MEELSPANTGLTQTNMGEHVKPLSLQRDICTPTLIEVWLAIAKM